MPTNILRARAAKPSPRLSKPAVSRTVLLHVGRVTIRAALLATTTADRIWSALPLFSTAETWGEAVHFELPIKTGRERAAVRNVSPGDICYWSEDDRVIIGFGPTPISRPTEIRLPSPCNVWAHALDDVTALRIVTPGEKVSIERIA